MQSGWRRWDVSRAETALKVLHPIFVALSVAHVKSVYDSVKITVTHDCPSQLCTVGDGNQAQTAVTAATKAHVKKHSLGSHEKAHLGHCIQCNKVLAWSCPTVHVRITKGKCSPLEVDNPHYKKHKKIILVFKWILFVSFIFFEWGCRPQPRN